MAIDYRCMNKYYPLLFYLHCIIDSFLNKLGEWNLQNNLEEDLKY